MKSGLEIIPATSYSQLRTVEDLAWAILPDFYGPTIAMDHIEYFIETLQTAAVLREAIMNGDEYYLLNSDQTPVGYIGLEKKDNALMLSKLYILSEARGHQLGAKSMAFVHDRARELGYDVVELFVHEDNHRAMSFYERQGYQKGELISHRFETGYVVRDWLYSKRLLD